MKTQNLILTILFAFIITVSQAQVTTEEVPVGSFSKIDVGSAFKVYLKKGDKESVKLEIDEKYRDQVKIEVKGDKLMVSTKWNINNPEKMNLYIVFKSLNSIEASGACKIESESEITADRLNLDLSGAGKIDIKISVKSLSASLSGAGTMKLSGVAENQTVDLSGAADYKAYDLKSNRVNIEVSGAGNAEIFAEKVIEADISGAGSVYYKGNPDSKSAEVSGAGKFKARE